MSGLALGGGAGAAPVPEADFRAPLSRNWLIEREKLLDVYAARAGKPCHGRVLEARLTPPTQSPGQPIHLVLSVKRVDSQSGEPACVAVGQWQPDVLVHDSAGRAIAVSKKGVMEYGHRNGFSAGSMHMLPLEPGDALGTDLTIDEHFVFPGPGRYTVLGGLDFVMGLPHVPFLVARPVELEIVAPAGAGSAKQAETASRAPVPGQKEAGDAEWKNLLPEAGRLHCACVLESLTAPDEPPSLRLIISLTRIAPRGEADQFKGDSTRPKATDYQILVRDPDGRPVAVNQSAKAAFADRHRGAESRLASPSSGLYFGIPMRVGDAVGAAIPLGEWFDMKKPGEYRVMVVRPPLRRGEPTWVAKPITVKVTK